MRTDKSHACRDIQLKRNAREKKGGSCLSIPYRTRFLWNFSPEFLGKESNFASWNITFLTFIAASSWLQKTRKRRYKSYKTPTTWQDIALSSGKEEELCSSLLSMLVMVLLHIFIHAWRQLWSRSQELFDIWFRRCPWSLCCSGHS